MCCVAGDGTVIGLPVVHYAYRGHRKGWKFLAHDMLKLQYRELLGQVDPICAALDGAWFRIELDRARTGLIDIPVHPGDAELLKAFHSSEYAKQYLRRWPLHLAGDSGTIRRVVQERSNAYDIANFGSTLGKSLATELATDWSLNSQFWLFADARNCARAVVQLQFRVEGTVLWAHVAGFYKVPGVEPQHKRERVALSGHLAVLQFLHQKARELHLQRVVLDVGVIAPFPYKLRLPKIELTGESYHLREIFLESP